MNRKSKGWLAEGAVKRFYEDAGKTVFNLSPQEPCADLLVQHYKGVWDVCEVKFLKVPPSIVNGLLTEPRFAPAYKRSLDERRAWCEDRGYGYHLWLVEGPPADVMKAHRLLFVGLAPSATRPGAFSLSIYEHEETTVKRPRLPIERETGTPHIAGNAAVARLPPSPRAIEEE